MESELCRHRRAHLPIKPESSEITRHSHTVDIVTQTMGSDAFPRDGVHLLCRYGCMARKASREAVPSHDDAPGIEKQVIIFNARPDVEPVNES